MEIDEKEMDDVDDRSGELCPFTGEPCTSDCKFYDSITDQCLFWLINSNLYHIRQELEE